MNKNQVEKVIWWALKNLLGNLLPFIPFGFLLPIAYPRIKAFFKVFLVGMFAVLFIEIFQYMTRLGSFDIDDIILSQHDGLGLRCRTASPAHHRNLYLCLSEQKGWRHRWQDGMIMAAAMAAVAITTTGADIATATTETAAVPAAITAVAAMGSRKSCRRRSRRKRCRKIM